MRRARQALLGIIVGALVAGLGFSAYIALRYPNNPRDSGLPTIFVGCLLASPPGGVLGAIIGALIPERKKPPS